MRHPSAPFPICCVLQVCVHHGDIDIIVTELHAEAGKFQAEVAWENPLEEFSANPAGNHSCESQLLPWTMWVELALFLVFLQRLFLPPWLGCWENSVSLAVLTSCMGAVWYPLECCSVLHWCSSLCLTPVPTTVYRLSGDFPRVMIYRKWGGRVGMSLVPAGAVGLSSPWRRLAFVFTKEPMSAPLPHCLHVFFSSVLG